MSIAKVTMSKNDFCFINAVAKYGRCCLEDVKISIDDEKVKFETTDTHILVNKIVDAEMLEHDPKGDMEYLIISTEFFKKILYLSKIKNLITLVIDFEKGTVSCNTEEYTIKANNKEGKFPNTKSVYPNYKDDDVLNTVYFTRNVLEKLLKSMNEQFIQVKILRDKNSPIMVSGCYACNDNSLNETNLIMPAIDR